MEIRLISGGGRVRECGRILASALEKREGGLILLPIPTTRDNIFINSTAVTIKSAVEMINQSTIIVGYGLPDEIIGRAEDVGARFFDASLDEEFLLDNARISANGALGYILTHSLKDMGDMKIGIVGYGRIGREMTRLCLLFGAEVRLYTAREGAAIELCEMGIDARLIDGEKDFSDLDLLVNTTPKRQIDDSLIPREVQIIDLASGSIFEPSERLIKLSSIPEAFYPITAGRLYSEAVLRFLGKEGGV
jgi:dipicolinate synthase subunit A